MNLQETTKATTNFFMFAYNYPHNFISQAWQTNHNLILHLEGKFNHWYSKVGSSGVMLKFYSELSDNNREILVKYINEYYSK